jgi:cyclic beta-1,2-glucan synthetase
MEVSRTLLDVIEGELTLARLAQLLQYVSNQKPLTEQELSLLVPALKLELTAKLAQLCPAVESLGQSSDPTEEASLAKGMEEIFQKFRVLISADFTALLEGASDVERVLGQDPSGIYPKMDEDTRRRYRQAVCALAREHSLGEGETAKRILSLSFQAEGDERHVGWYIFREPLGKKAKKHSGAGYLSALIFSVLVISLFLGFLWVAPRPPFCFCCPYLTL